MSRVWFIQLKPIVDSKETHRASPALTPGVFLGWATKPGGEWAGRYFCSALTEFVGMDLRVGGHVRVQEVYEVYPDDDDVFFPLKAMYDRANATLEGLSAPYGSIGDVAPQSLNDLGMIGAKPPQRVGERQGSDALPDPSTIPDDDPKDVQDALDALGPGPVGNDEDETAGQPVAPEAQPLAPQGDSSSASSGHWPGHPQPPAVADHGPRPADWAECLPWPVPRHWDIMDDKVKAKLKWAKPFLRPPNNEPHPDIFWIKDDTLVRGKVNPEEEWLYEGTGRAF